LFRFAMSSADVFSEGLTQGFSLLRLENQSTYGAAFPAVKFN